VVAETPGLAVAPIAPLPFRSIAAAVTANPALRKRSRRSVSFMAGSPLAASAELRALTFDQRCYGALLLRLHVRGDAGRKWSINVTGEHHELIPSNILHVKTICNSGFAAAWSNIELWNTIGNGDKLAVNSASRRT
jgi:hypothetical protein